MLKRKQNFYVKVVENYKIKINKGTPVFEKQVFK